MKIPRPPHNWRLSVRQAVAVQKRLAGMIDDSPGVGDMRYVAGLDVAFPARGDRCIGGVVLWDRVAQIVLERKTAVRTVEFPYVPGFLSFREAPVLIQALRSLRNVPDVLMCDGQGRAHPRGFGLACHLGLLVGIPAVGCGKSRLVGTYEQPGSRRGDRSPLFFRDDIVGTVLRTRTGVKPVYVSVGHGMSLLQAEELILDCYAGYRLPEPARLADQLVAAEKRERFS